MEEEEIDEMENSEYINRNLSTTENEIREYIIKKLILFYKYNSEIESIINDKNNKPYSPFYKNYYIIQEKWINVFLYYYNYNKILPIIKRHKYNLNSEIISNDLYKIIKKKNNKEEILNNKEFELKLNNYLRSDKNYFPKKIKMIIENGHKEFNFYDQFMILEEKLYSEIKEDKGITHTFLHNPIKVEIFIFENYFIYLIDNNIFAFGIIHNSEKENFYKLKVLILIITDEEFYGEIDLFKSFIQEKIQKKIKNNNYELEIYSINNQNYTKMNITPFKNPSNNKTSYYIINNNINEESIKDNKCPEKIIEPEEEEAKTLCTTNIEDINNLYTIEETTGDGNCLFNAFSQLIFGNENYSTIIRQKLCDFIKKNNKYKNFFETNEQEQYISNMQRDQEYGGEFEINAFSNFCDIKLTWFINDINNESNQNKNIKTKIYNEEKEGNFAIILNNYGENSLKNHFSSCIYKNGNDISEEKLKQIRNKFLQEDLSNKNNEYINQKKIDLYSECDDNYDYNDFEQNANYLNDENKSNQIFIEEFINDNNEEKKNEQQKNGEKKNEQQKNEKGKNEKDKNEQEKNEQEKNGEKKNEKGKNEKGKNEKEKNEQEKNEEKKNEQEKNEKEKNEEKKNEQQENEKEKNEQQKNEQQKNEKNSNTKPINKEEEKFNKYYKDFVKRTDKETKKKINKIKKEKERMENAKKKRKELEINKNEQLRNRQKARDNYCKNRKNYTQNINEKLQKYNNS